MKVVFIYARVNRDFRTFVIILAKQHITARWQQTTHCNLQRALNRVQNIRATLQHDVEHARHHCAYRRGCRETKPTDDGKI